MLANILRTGIMAASAALPENNVIANVVFASSLQILIAVGYFIIYTIVTATYRVLSTQEAMHDPSYQKDVDFDIEHDIDGDLGEIDLGYNDQSKQAHRARLPGLRYLRDKLHSEADRLASHIFSQRGGWFHKPVENVTESSIDDNFSVTSHDEDNIDNTAVNKPLCKTVILPARGEDDAADNSKKVVPIYTGESEYTRDEYSTRKKNEKKINAVRGEKYSSDTTNDLPERPFGDEHASNIYSDVYALGISVFIIHYCLDAASMNPTMFLLIGLTILAFKDQLRVSREDPMSERIEEIPLVRALSISAFLLIVAAQICILVGISRVPTYHTAARDGGILQVPAPRTVLEFFMAIIFPLLAPVSLHFIRRRKSANHISLLVRTALPCTVLMALWFITCFGAMNEQIRTKLSVDSVNITINTLTQIDDTQLPTLLIAPFLKVPALLCLLSCCLSGKTVDMVCSLAFIFYAKQYNAVRDEKMRQMLLIGLIFAVFAWSMCTLRYWRWLMLYITKSFSR